ncbi:MAG: hypothetical protein J0H73_00865, partial [Salana multivorans]|nr:hypothetical protein [Salana multivorans]
MTSHRRPGAGRIAVGAGVLAGVLLAAGGGVLNALDARAASAQLADPASTSDTVDGTAVSADVPLLNTELEARDLV